MLQKEPGEEASSGQSKQDIIGPEKTLGFSLRVMVCYTSLCIAFSFRLSFPTRARSF